MSEPTQPTDPTTPPEADDAAAQQPKPVDWEAEAKKWEKRSKDNYAKLKEAEPKLSEYERMVEASKTAEQRQAEELSKWQNEAQQWRQAAVGSRIEALAAGVFADPSDAVTALADRNYLDAGGQIDTEAITRDLAEVLERKPHWRRQDPAPQGPRAPAPNPAQGSGGNPASTDPAQALAAIFQGQLRS